MLSEISLMTINEPSHLRQPLDIVSELQKALDK